MALALHLWQLSIRLDLLHGFRWTLEFLGVLLITQFNHFLLLFIWKLLRDNLLDIIIVDFSILVVVGLLLMVIILFREDFHNHLLLINILLASLLQSLLFQLGSLDGLMELNIIFIDV